jgi:hypothetical protein
MSCADHQRKEADAILLERARRVLQRRFYAEIVTDPTAHAVSEWLRRAAAHLRIEARDELLPEPGGQLGPGPDRQCQP